jgi:hypothetical protein
MVIISASSAIAAAIPARCPANTHELGWGEAPCISDDRHLSASGDSVWNYATDRDARLPLRIEIAVAGVVAGSLLLVTAFWSRGPTAMVK